MAVIAASPLVELHNSSQVCDLLLNGRRNYNLSMGVAIIINKKMSRGYQPFHHVDPQREKAMRSIFIANVAFETTEEQLRKILSEVE